MCIDWNIYRSFVYGTWEPKLIGVVADIVKEGMTVIDVGAHIGYYSLYFAKCVGPAGRVFSFEPVPENLELLRKNIQLNQISWIQTFSNAVYSCEKEVSIAVPEDSPNAGGGSVVQDRGSRHFSVAAVTLDSFCSSAGVRPDVIKMDVEGAEYDVLLGARNTIEWFGPKLLVELHHFDGDASAHPVPELLRSYGYEVNWIERWELTSHILATPGPVRVAASRQPAV